jgi:fluoride exporter
VFVGVLGGFTTFSSFVLDTLTVVRAGDQATAFWNVAGQTALGLVAVWVGYHMGALRID